MIEIVLPEVGGYCQKMMSQFASWNSLFSKASAGQCDFPVLFWIDGNFDVATIRYDSATPEQSGTREMSPKYEFGKPTLLNNSPGQRMDRLTR